MTLQEITGDLFSIKDGFDAICIPTNGMVKTNGELVMGAGVAKFAALHFPGITKVLGYKVKECGNHVYLATVEYDHKLVLGGLNGVYELYQHVLSFPTKHNWRDRSSLSLIIRSAEELSHFILAYHWNTVALPRVGCGLGGLDWTEVTPVLEAVFEKHGVIDRVVVINKEA